MSLALAAQPQPESMERMQVLCCPGWKSCRGVQDPVMCPLLQEDGASETGQMDRHTLQIWWFPIALSEVFGLRLLLLSFS